MVNFEPTPEQQRFIEAQVRSGRFRDAGEAIRAGLRLWMRVEQDRRERYEAWVEDTNRKIQEGLDDLDRGDTATWEEVVRAMDERIDRVRKSSENRGKTP